MYRRKSLNSFEFHDQAPTYKQVQTAFPDRMPFVTHCDNVLAGERYPLHLEFDT